MQDDIHDPLKTKSVHSYSVNLIEECLDYSADTSLCLCVSVSTWIRINRKPKELPQAMGQQYCASDAYF